MEYLDVLDGQGNKVGKTKERSLVHQDGDWHTTVFIWVINSKQELLIARRSPLKDLSPNLWCTAVGGHVKAGESNLNTALQEAKEEIGICFQPEQLEFLYTARLQQSFKEGRLLNNEFSSTYLVQADLDPSQIIFQEEEIAEVRLIPFREFEQWIREKPEEIFDHPEDYQKLFAVLHQRFD